MQCLTSKFTKVTDLQPVASKSWTARFELKKSFSGCQEVKPLRNYSSNNTIHAQRTTIQPSKATRLPAQLSASVVYGLAQSKCEQVRTPHRKFIGKNRSNSKISDKPERRRNTNNATRRLRDNSNDDGMSQTS